MINNQREGGLTTRGRFDDEFIDLKKKNMNNKTLEIAFQMGGVNRNIGKKSC
jgi:hypothetical protein